MDIESLTVPNTAIDKRGHKIYNFSEDIPISIHRFSNGNTFVDSIIFSSCALCGKSPGWEINPESGQFQLNQECTYANVAPYQVKLSVPSGKIVFADSLFDVFPELHEIVDIDWVSA